jgi:hypothetical protein
VHMQASAGLKHCKASCTTTLHGRFLRPRRLAVYCTAQPPSSGPSQQQQDGTHSASSTSSRSSTPSVAVQDIEQPQGVGTGSFTDFDAAGPMAAQLAGQLVIVSAATSSTGVLNPAQTSTHGDSSAGQPSTSMLPEGLPSPRSVEASLTSSVTSFSRCAELISAA